MSCSAEYEYLDTEEEILQGMFFFLWWLEFLLDPPVLSDHATLNNKGAFAQCYLRFSDLGDATATPSPFQLL